MKGLERQPVIWITSRSQAQRKEGKKENQIKREIASCHNMTRALPWSVAEGPLVFGNRSWLCGEGRQAAVPWSFIYFLVSERG